MKDRNSNQFIELEKNIRNETFSKHQMIWLDDADKSDVIKLVQEANRLLAESNMREMTEEEELEDDAGGGYFEEDD